MIEITFGKMNIPENERFIGFAGDNLRSTKTFLLKNFAEENCIYRLYLTFGKESTNHFVLDSKVENGSTYLEWNISEDHILKSGLVKAQIKAFCDDEMIFHTTHDYFLIAPTLEFDEISDKEITEFLEYEKRLNEMLYKITSHENNFVPVDRKIAGLNLQSDITTELLSDAMKVYPILRLTSAPTKSTEGKIGQLAFERSTTNGTDFDNKLYICAAVNSNGEYIWYNISSENSAEINSISNLSINNNGELEVGFSNGEKNNLGRVVGADGEKGIDGKDGYSPKITVSETDIGYDFTIEHSENFVENVSINHGIDGKNGADGKDGQNGQNGYTPLKGIDYFDGKDGYTPIKGTDYYTNEDKAEFVNYIAYELAKRGQLKPEFADSVEECTDTSKMYVLPDGYIYSYMKHTEEVVIPGETITTPAKAIIIKGYRYSRSGEAFQAQSNTASVIFPIDITKTTTSENPVDFKLTNMLGHATYTSLYNGSTNTLFPSELASRVATGTYTEFKSYGLPVGKWFVVFFVQYTGTETFENASFSYDDVTFAVGDNMEVYSDPSYASLAEFSSTTTTEGTTETIETEGFYSTGLSFAPADYEDRIIKLEDKTKVNEERIDVLEDSITNVDDKSKRIVIDSSVQALESSVSMTVPQLKKNKTIAFSGLYTGELNELTIVQGEGTGFTEVKCVVNPTSLTIMKDGTNVYTAEHGLTFGSYFSIVLATKNLNKTKAYLSSGGKTFTSAEFVWNSSRSNLKVYTNTPFTQYQLSFGSNDFDKKIWMYGDSYFDHWLPLSINRGYTNCLADGYSGGGSTAGLASFKLALEHGTPSKVVWCLGMNDGDSTVVNQSWLNAITSVKEICDTHSIELWVATIPNVPSKNHTYKNAYIRENFSYIDIAKYVGANESTAWYTGLLSSDKIHPSTEGDFYIANIMENLFPEMLDV